MSFRDEKITEKQLTILKFLNILDKGDPVRPSKIGVMNNIHSHDASKWVCSGMIWLIHYGLAIRCGRGKYRITEHGRYYLQHFV